MSKMLKSKKWLTALAVIACLGALVWVVAALGALNGAIFTTNEDASITNLNIFQFKDQVYLNAGPLGNAPCDSAGLPSGDYYFQVTSPPGAGPVELLSSDAIADRKFHVEDGLIMQNLGSHGTGTGKCGSISIQLVPYLTTPNPGGEYKVWVTRVGDYNPSNPSTTFGFKSALSKTDTFKVLFPEGGGGPYPLLITGTKYYDANANGVWDQSESAEVGIQGWKVQKTPPLETPDVTYTDSVGEYSFIVAPSDSPITYTITEILPPGGTWMATTATFGQVTVSVNSVSGPDFGNVCLGAGGGLTLGFWSNKNGEKVMTRNTEVGGMEGELLILRGLNLRNADGTDFDPASYATFRTWLLSANATNMAYMLSAQLAAMELNVLNGFVDPNALIYAQGLSPSSGKVAGFVTISDLMARANDELGQHGNTPAGSEFRGYQESLKNALDDANNNKNFVQAGPCPVPVY
jgi:hypothetical protein